MSIEVPTRGVVSVEGPNGCGKSVLLSAASGVVSVPQIEVAWALEPAHPPILAAQYPELQIFEERARDEVIFAAVRRGLAKPASLTHASRLIEDLGFESSSFLERRSWELSAGEKRVLQIVSALAAPSSLWILDEPTAGLDPRTRRRLAGVVAGLAEAGAFLVATQDLEWVEEVSDRRIPLALRTKASVASPGQKTD